MHTHLMPVGEQEAFAQRKGNKMHRQSGPRVLSLMLIVAALGVSGCKSAKVIEISGKSAGGAQFQNHGNNTHDVKYYAIQSLEFKLSNKWTIGVGYQRTDIDEGTGDNENLILFEVGYPMNAPKKPEKTAEEQQIEGLERELRLLDTELAAARMESPDGSSGALVQAGKVK